MSGVEESEERSEVAFFLFLEGPAHRFPWQSGEQEGLGNPRTRVAGASRRG